MDCRILESKRCAITQGCREGHVAIDLVKEGYMLDYIVAHSDGTITVLQDGLGNMKGTNSYGNYVIIDHGNGYQTLYAHMLKGLPVTKGQFVKAGQRLGYMSDSGNAYGGHVHFEVRKNGIQIDPTNYLNADLWVEEPVENEHKLGEVVTINGVYVSSTSTEKLNPAITRGTITKIIEGARNPYLLDNGNIGWVNDDCIVGEDTTKYLSNPGYNGYSIVDGLNQIGVDSSYGYRARLAQANGIEGYVGSASQNTAMVEMLKKGTLKSV